MLFATVPKTGVKKYYRLVFWQYDIRFSEMFWRVLSVSKAVFPQRFTERNFHFAVSAFYSRHQIASFFFGKHIHATSVTRNPARDKRIIERICG